MNTAASAPAAPVKPYNYRTVQDSDPLYVVNEVTKTGLASGRITFQVHIDGDFRPVTVEDSWVPQDLSSQALPSIIAKTMGFRSLVERRILVPMHPEQAEGVLLSTAAQAEIRRRQRIRENQVNNGDNRLRVPAHRGPIHYDDEMLQRLASNNRPTEASRLLNPRVDDYMRGDGVAVPEAAHDLSGAAHVISDAQAPNMGVELLARYNSGKITLDEAIATMQALGPVLSEEEKLRLLAVNNLPPGLAAVVAQM